MFKKVMILLIAVIFVSSGAFALISNYALENTNDSENNSLVNDIKDMSFSESFLNNIKNDNIMDGFNDYWQYTFGYLVNVDGELRHYINDNGAYYLESEGILDRYIQCVDCSGFIPIGKITNPLPKAAICHHNDMSGLNFSEAIKYSYTRDEAYNLWVYEGMPVYDDEHFNTRPSPPMIDTIYCENCHGIVILKNYDDSWVDSYLNIGITPITSLSIPNVSCSHYNGSLDLFDTPIEDFYSGWFKSIDDYNQFMYKAIHSLNDNSTSLENKTLNDISLEKWNHIYDVPENFSYVEYKSLNNNISDNPTVIPDVDYEPVYVPEQNILENTSIE